ncbi:MAG TPA: hypothetical protein PLB81_00810 [Deltaproteobacteria bacterium]|nr:hypothetical protein [Deltaproteobacteria bacterium]
MKRWKIDAEHITISTIVSLLATVAIVFMVKTLQPELIDFKPGTAVFIFIGVFTANLIIEAGRQRHDKEHGE